MISKKYIAEGIGTFTLAFIVLGAISYAQVLPVPVPVIAALTLGIFVYTIGAISGCHINPAVTLGLLSVKKISVHNALWYLIAQFSGAILAILVGSFFGITNDQAVVPSFSTSVFLAEMIGSFFFTFGIASIVYGNVKDEVSGIVIGGSLLLGGLVASFAGSASILNPAVALTLSLLSVTYALAPIAGAICGFQAYKFVAGKG